VSDVNNTRRLCLPTRKIGLVGAAAVAVVGLMSGHALAAGHAPSGAIFTTVADGSEVNFNIYPSKDAVYLDGGPGPGAPQTAAGLDDGTYVFQVTDPSGKTLLSTDAAQCRQFMVTNGIITSTDPSPASCAHVTGLDVDHGAITIQLVPYNDTPNPGGEYKVCYPGQQLRLQRGHDHGELHRQGQQARLRPRLQQDR